MKKKYVNPKNNTYSLFEFQSKYGTEQACEEALFKLKWANGFKCPKCGSEHYTVVGGRRLALYQCAECHSQTTVTAGTVFANTKLPLTKWFIALYFVATNKDGISSVALAKYIDVTLKTAWTMLHKIRSAMGSRDALYKLVNSVEMDESYFGGKHEGKRGRGSENKTLVAAALELSDTGEPLFLKMQTIHDTKGETLLNFAKSNIGEGSAIHSDALRSYHTLSQNYDMDIKKYNPTDDTEHLKWLHVMISNIKANIEGAYHGIDNKYIQYYLDEFSYRFNRRFSLKPVLDHLLECCVWAPYRKFAELCI